MTRGGSKRSSTYTSSRGDSNPQLDIMYDKVYREKAVNLRNNVYIQSETALEEEVKAGSCDDPAGRHLGRGGPTNPPQKEQCGKTVHTVQAHWARGAKT